MRKQIFMLIEDAFHLKVMSWPRVVGEIWEGHYHYLFEGMVPEPLLGETPVVSWKRMDEETLNPIIKRLEMQMKSLHENMMNLGVLVSNFLTFYEFHSSISLSSLASIPLFYLLLAIEPHSQFEPTIPKP